MAKLITTPRRLLTSYDRKVMSYNPTFYLPMGDDFDNAQLADLSGNGISVVYNDQGKGFYQLGAPGIGDGKPSTFQGSLDGDYQGGSFDIHKPIDSLFPWSEGSISAWIYHDLNEVSVGGAARFWDLRCQTWGQKDFILQIVGTTWFVPVVGIGGGLDFNLFAIPAAFNVPQWNHVLMTWSVPSNNWRLFIGGVSFLDRAPTSGIFSTPGDDFVIPAGLMGGVISPLGGMMGRMAKFAVIPEYLGVEAAIDLSFAG